MEQKPLTIAIVGCGNIAGAYGKTLQNHPQLRLLGATSRTRTRAEDFVAQFGGKLYPSLDALVADEEVDLVVNLSIHDAHVEVITQCLNAGKHVYSEKPLALTSAEAWRLVALAEAKGLHFGCAPGTMLGEAQQTAWKAIRAGQLGQVRVAYAEVNWGRIESWHPSPTPFYAVGPLFDVAVYPLTILTTIFGPARTITAFQKVIYPDRVTTEGVPFHITTPDFSIAAIEFASGLVGRLTTNFYVNTHTRQKGIEFHGDRGSLYLSSWQDFNGSVEYADFAQQAPASNAYTPLPYVRQPYPGIDWSRGVLDMAEALKADRPQRLTAAQAAHVVDIVCGIQEAAITGQRVEISSDFSPPVPMEWAT